MIKIGLRHPSGLEIEFEGDKDDFVAFAEFLAGDLGGFIRAITPANAVDSEISALEGAEDDEGTDDDEVTEGAALGSGGAISPRAIAARIEQLGATTDIDRVTIVAQAAVDAGFEGIDYDTIEDLYTAMGIPKPARFAKAFSNAKTRGLVKSVKYGMWAPTVQGENYARYGKKPARRGSGKRAGPSEPLRELPGGGPTEI
jgi:hypothetical protein